MKVLCAPDSFKESLGAAEVAAAMAAGIKRAAPQSICDVCPVGDGGEGTLDALLAAVMGQIRHATVHDPVGRPMQARFGICSNGMGIVEMAQAAGLGLLARELRDPTRTSSFGAGELIREAARAGCNPIIVCIGGSATIDGGTGMAQAMGSKFFDRSGKLIVEPMTGGKLRDVARIERPRDVPTLRVACDVTNPLLGPQGAATVYGPQKGATPQQVRKLEAGLEHLAVIAGGDPTFPGSGAAGGAGFGLAAICGAKLERGIDLVLEAVHFDERCCDAHLVLTGEGRLDSQSLQGKACMGVTKAAARRGVPTIAIVGSTGEGAANCVDPRRAGLLTRYVSLAERFGMPRALAEPATLIELIAFELVCKT